MAFNFGHMAPILGKYMDTDIMDIRRKITITNSNGTKGELDPKEPLYTSIPCHISFDSADNANSTTVDVQPIIMSITISCDTKVDLRSGDLITAKKMDSSGTIFETYRGIIGEPYVVQSRKRAHMAVQTYKESK